MQETDADQYVAEQLSLFGAGSTDDAFHNLLEAPVDIAESLVTAFHRSGDPHVQAFILFVAWRSHDPRFLRLLGMALASTTREVWKEAIDGLVSFASAESLDTLRKALWYQDEEKRSWIKEAIDQVEVAMKGD